MTSVISKSTVEEALSKKNFHEHQLTLASHAAFNWSAETAASRNNAMYLPYLLKKGFLHARVYFRGVVPEAFVVLRDGQFATRHDDVNNPVRAGMVPTEVYGSANGESRTVNIYDFTPDSFARALEFASQTVVEHATSFAYASPPDITFGDVVCGAVLDTKQSRMRFSIVMVEGVSTDSAPVVNADPNAVLMGKKSGSVGRCNASSLRAKMLAMATGQTPFPGWNHLIAYIELSFGSPMINPAKFADIAHAQMDPRMYWEGARHPAPVEAKLVSRGPVLRTSPAVLADPQRPVFAYLAGSPPPPVTSFLNTIGSHPSSVILWDMDGRVGFEIFKESLEKFVTKINSSEYDVVLDGSIFGYTHSLAVETVNALMLGKKPPQKVCCFLNKWPMPWEARTNMCRLNAVSPLAFTMKPILVIIIGNTHMPRGLVDFKSEFPELCAVFKAVKGVGDTGTLDAVISGFMAKHAKAPGVDILVQGFKKDAKMLPVDHRLKIAAEFSRMSQDDLSMWMDHLTLSQDFEQYAGEMGAPTDHFIPMRSIVVGGMIRQRDSIRGYPEYASSSGKLMESCIELSPTETALTFPIPVRVLLCLAQHFVKGPCVTAVSSTEKYPGDVRMSCALGINVLVHAQGPYSGSSAAPVKSLNAQDMLDVEGYSVIAPNELKALNDLRPDAISVFTKAMHVTRPGPDSCEFSVQQAMIELAGFMVTNEFASRNADFVHKYWTAPPSKAFAHAYSGAAPESLSICPLRTNNFGLAHKAPFPIACPSICSKTIDALGIRRLLRMLAHPSVMAQEYASYSEYIGPMTIITDWDRCTDIYVWVKNPRGTYSMRVNPTGKFLHIDRTAQGTSVREVTFMESYFFPPKPVTVAYYAVRDPHLFMGMGSALIAPHTVFAVSRDPQALVVQAMAEHATGHGASGHLIAALMMHESHLLHYLTEVHHNIHRQSSVYLIPFDEPKGAVEYHTIAEYNDALVNVANFFGNCGSTTDFKVRMLLKLAFAGTFFNTLSCLRPG